MRTLLDYWAVLLVFPLLLIIIIIMAIMGDAMLVGLTLPAIVGTVLCIGVGITKKKGKKNG